MSFDYKGACRSGDSVACNVIDSCWAGDSKSCDLIQSGVSPHQASPLGVDSLVSFADFLSLLGAVLAVFSSLVALYVVWRACRLYLFSVRRL